MLLLIRIITLLLLNLRRIPVDSRSKPREVLQSVSRMMRQQIDQIQHRHNVRRVPPFCFGSIFDLPSPRKGQPDARHLLRISFKNPEEDYIFIQEMQSNQAVLACHRKSRLQLAVIRESHSATPLNMLEIFSRIQHPNIAAIINVYFYEGRLLIVGEHLEVSLLDLGVKELPLEEWEIATIIEQVSLYFVSNKVLI